MSEQKQIADMIEDVDRLHRKSIKITQRQLLKGVPVECRRMRARLRLMIAVAFRSGAIAERLRARKLGKN